MPYTYDDIAKMIDHSLLNPTLTEADLVAGCKLAVAFTLEITDPGAEVVSYEFRFF